MHAWFVGPVSPVGFFEFFLKNNCKAKESILVVLFWKMPIIIPLSKIKSGKRTTKRTTKRTAKEPILEVIQCMGKLTVYGLRFTVSHVIFFKPWTPKWSYGFANRNAACKQIVNRERVFATLRFGVACNCGFFLKATWNFKIKHVILCEKQKLKP